MYFNDRYERMVRGYKARTVDNLLKRKLEGIGAVLIEGSK